LFDAGTLLLRNKSCLYKTSLAKIAETNAEVVSVGNDAGEPIVLPVAKRGRIWFTGEDFFASSPSANLAGVKRRRIQ
jgi:hypothetical protein